MLAITAKLVRNRLRDLSTKLAELHNLPNPFDRFAELKQSLHDHFQMIEEIGCEDPSIVAAWKSAKQYAQATWPDVSDQAGLRVDAMIGYWEGIGEDELGIAIELVLREGTITKSSLGPFVAASYRELEERTIRWPDVCARVCSMLADLEFGTKPPVDDDTEFKYEQFDRFRKANLTDDEVVTLLEHCNTKIAGNGRGKRQSIIESKRKTENESRNTRINSESLKKLINKVLNGELYRMRLNADDRAQFFVDYHKWSTSKSATKSAT